MSFRSRLAGILRLAAGVGDPVPPLEPRHERREIARERHHLDGEPPWPPEERHENPGPREVQDIAPGLAGLGASASHRVVGGDD